MNTFAIFYPTHYTGYNNITSIINLQNYILNLQYLCKRKKANLNWIKMKKIESHKADHNIQQSQNKPFLESVDDCISRQMENYGKFSRIRLYDRL